MKLSELAPACAIGLAVTAVCAGQQMLPFGRRMLLVRLPDRNLAAVAQAGASLVRLPAPGFAVLYGDASRVRAGFGLALAWQDGAPCAARP